LYVSLQDEDKIIALARDAQSGRLTANAPFRVEPAERLGPRHYCCHPTRDLVYFSNEQGSSVTSYRLDPAAGTLAAVQTITSLPAGFTARNTCSQVHLTPHADDQHRARQTDQEGSDHGPAAPLRQQLGRNTGVVQFGLDQDVGRAAEAAERIELAHQPLIERDVGAHLAVTFGIDPAPVEYGHIVVQVNGRRANASSRQLFRPRLDNKLSPNGNRAEKLRSPSARMDRRSTRAWEMQDGRHWRLHAAR
jgi:hypothetical protein